MFFKLELSRKPEEPVVARSNYIQHFGNSTFADFTIQTSDGDEFPVHRLILAEVSPFFNKMFTVDMQEKKLSSVLFEDISSAVLKESLMFMYSGKADIKDYKMAIKILDAAERFDIPGLKEACIEMLFDCINEQSLFEILAAADLFNSEGLEEKCLEFIVE